MHTLYIRYIQSGLDALGTVIVTKIVICTVLRQQILVDKLGDENFELLMSLSLFLYQLGSCYFSHENISTIFNQNIKSTLITTPITITGESYNYNRGILQIIPSNNEIIVVRAVSVVVASDLLRYSLAKYS